MKSYRIVLAAALFGAALAHAQAPPSIDTLLNQARSQAAADHRAIFVIFHASW